MSDVLLTGASGFIGRALVEKLAAHSYSGKRALRSPVSASVNNWTDVMIGDIDGNTDWHGALKGVDTVVHLAARVHVMKDTASDPSAGFRRVNTEGTARLAEQAAAAGVRRFVYLSSIKVNGESTDGRPPFSETDSPAPMDPYAISKWHAEESLRRVAKNSRLEVVIIRSPLVYGPGVKANFLSMMRWLNRGLPLPLGSIDNKRSFVALDNLVDLILACIDNPAAANQLFLAGDGEDLSTTDLLRRMAAALGRTARLLPVPVWIVKAGGTMLGKRGAVQRLCGSLQVDIGKANELLGWTPSITVDAALRKTAEDFLNFHLKRATGDPGN